MTEMTDAPLDALTRAELALGYAMVPDEIITLLTKGDGKLVPPGALAGAIAAARAAGAVEIGEDNPIWKAIDHGGGQTCDVCGVIRSLNEAGFIIAPANMVKVDPAAARPRGGEISDRAVELQKIANDVMPELRRRLDDWLRSDMLPGSSEYMSLEQELWDNKIGILRCLEYVAAQQVTLHHGLTADSKALIAHAISLLEDVVKADQHREPNNTMQDTAMDGPLAQRARWSIKKLRPLIAEHEETKS